MYLVSTLRACEAQPRFIAQRSEVHEGHVFYFFCKRRQGDPVKYTKRLKSKPCHNPCSSLFGMLPRVTSAVLSAFLSARICSCTARVSMATPHAAPHRVLQLRAQVAVLLALQVQQRGQQRLVGVQFKNLHLHCLAQGLSTNPTVKNAEGSCAEITGDNFTPPVCRGAADTRAANQPPSPSLIFCCSNSSIPSH